MQKPRKPNEEEMQALLREELEGEGYAKAAPGDKAEIRKFAEWEVSEAYVGVFDDYVTLGPDYAGKVMFVVWSISPTAYEVYIWREGKMQRVRQADAIRELPAGI